MARLSILLLALLAAACALAPNEPPAKSAHQQVCVVDPDTGKEDCDAAGKESPPDSDEDCTVVEQSPTLNHGGAPAVHPFCTPSESVKTLKKKKPRG